MSSHQKTRPLSGFFSHYKPYKKLLAADLLCALGVAVLALALPLCVRSLTQNVWATGEIMAIGLLMLAIIASQTLLAVFYDYKGHDMGAKIERDMRGQLFAHYQKLPFDFYDRQKIGHLMSRLTGDLLDLTELYHHGPENLVVYGTQFIGAWVVLFAINPRLTGIISLILPVMALYSFIFYRRLTVAYRESYERIADVNAQAEENLSGIRDVKGFAAEDYEIARFARENQRFYESRARIYKQEALHFTVMEKFFTPLITVALVVVGSLWIAEGDMSLSDLLIFILYAAYLTGPVPRLAFMVQQYQEGLAGYRRFSEIMALTPDIADAKDAVDLTVTQGRITFDNVTFRYNDKHEYVLKDLCLHIQPGETVAIVGPSGIGKTTLCSLIPRFYEAGGGDIQIDGVSIRAVTLSSLRRQIGVVRQETFLFSGTVLENILYGRPTATEAEAVAAAQKAHAHEFITQLPQGYHTPVGQRGVRLSGGQQQRISIARMFLKNPPLLILDEATSALDYESESAVMRGLKTLAQGRTTLIIAHRLSTVRNANRIIVLTHEGIAEQGTHEQLCEMNGLYAHMCRAQGV